MPFGAVFSEKDPENRYYMVVTTAKELYKKSYSYLLKKTLRMLNIPKKYIYMVHNQHLNIYNSDNFSEAHVFMLYYVTGLRVTVKVFSSCGSALGTY